ncbi:MAG: glutamate--tRNA ligase [Deltaproteobacteria bacterium]|nr:glutamate--tRNA ligase [Deltaproteobacteria bacterium]
MTEPVIVRFAPSPTGYLHIGGARTAIFNYLYARKTGGKFILRIEDTDTERSTEKAIDGILEGLSWLGLDWDEGPNFQSRFIDAHRETADRLLKSGHAYKCFCTKEELDVKREEARKQKQTYQYDRTCRHLSPEEVSERESSGIPFTIRFRVPEGAGAVRFSDVVYGPIEKQYADLDDFVIVRSNGQPLYVLSNAVDDMQDGITHVIRGQDGLANTPKQVLIYEALNVPVPRFAHMSLTLDPQKAKISKRRHGEAVAIHFYREHGFLPWALVNFLVLLGWSPGDSREYFTKPELIEAFSLEGISKTNSVFNIRKDDPRFFTDPKAINTNAHYLRTLPVEAILPAVREQMEKAGLWNPAWEKEKAQWFLSTVDLLRARFHTTVDFVELGRAYFSDDFPMDSKAVEKNILKHDMLRKWLPEMAHRLSEIPDFTKPAIESVLEKVLKEMGVKPGVLMNAVRTAVTGQPKGPGFFEFILTIGQREVVRRLREAALWFKNV